MLELQKLNKRSLHLINYSQLAIYGSRLIKFSRKEGSLPALKILQKTFQTWGICQGYARVYILVLKPYIFLSSPGSSSNNTAICQYFLCIHPFPQCFYSPPDEYILLFYFLLSSLLSTSFFSVSFFSHFFLFLQFLHFSCPFFKLFPTNSP